MHNDQLENWFNAKPDNINDWLNEGLRIGVDVFNMHTGIVSEIHSQSYLIKAVYSKLGEVFTPGQEFELANTYCAAVSKTHKTITYKQVGAIPTMILHPVYVAVQLESYIGTPLYDKNKSFIGTLNFSSHAIRRNDYSAEEIVLIERMAKKISQLMYQAI
ncbi:MAG TPA: GAF domain-containing protein [Gammaproteobacteria bacterium]